MGAHHSFLSDHTVSDLIDPGVVVAGLDGERRNSLQFYFNPTARIGSQTVGQVLRLLQDEDVEDAPLDIDPLNTFRQAEAALVVFGCRDAVQLLNEIEAGHLEARDVNTVAQEWFDRRVVDTSVMSLMPEMQLLRVQKTDGLAGVVQLMAASKSHRIVVVSQDSSCIEHLLRQSDVLRYLQHNLAHLSHSVQRRSLKELQLGHLSSIVHVRDTQPVYEAFRACASHKISSVLVLDGQDRIVGSVGVEAIRAVNSRDKLQLLWLPVRDFLASFCSASNTIDTRQTFASLINTLVERQWYRVFLTSHRDPKCQGVITLADVLAQIFASELEVIQAGMKSQKK